MFAIYPELQQTMSRSSLSQATYCLRVTTETGTMLACAHECGKPASHGLPRQADTSSCPPLDDASRVLGDPRLDWPRARIH